MDQEIPVPPPQESTLNYGELYARPFSKTSTYIRFSQTVEESIGCMYDMTEDDELFLKSYNQKRAASAKLSEDGFERIMDVFEETSELKAPYASIDQTIVPYDEMLQGLQELQELDKAKLITHAKEIYEYWKSRRQALNNQPLHPTLKFEKHQESDEADPYVCFRRREVRQTRKTRARDVQSAEKLKRLRKELEEGRQLVRAAHNRELLKAEMLKADRAIFELRAQLKEHKIRLGIKTDDEDLINQKVRLRPSARLRHPQFRANALLQPQKRKAPEAPAVQRPPPPTQLRIATRQDGRPAEADLSLLSDRLAEKENELRADIEKKVLSHNEWNRDHLDLTRGPLSPVRGPRQETSFRPAKTQYLMTPPASVSSASLEEPTPMDLDKPQPPPPVFKFRGAARDEQSRENPPLYRRRIGRLNRLWIDRRGLASPPRDVCAEVLDRYKYDQSSDEEDDVPMYEVDPFDTNALRFRASIPLPPWTANRGVTPHPRAPLPPPQPQPHPVPQAQPQASQAAPPQAPPQAPSQATSQAQPQPQPPQAPPQAQAAA